MGNKSPVTDFVEKAAPIIKRRAFPDTAVVAPKVHRGVDGLDPTAGFTSSEGLGVKRIPVGYGAVQVTEVYEVETVWLVRPWLGAILDLELEIRGHPLGL